MPDDPQKDEATKRGDELLRRLLNTPPTPRKPAKGDKPKQKSGDATAAPTRVAPKA